MEEGKKGFIIYTDVKETLDNLSDEDVGKLFRGIVNYEVSGDDPDFSGELKFAFIPIRQQLDRDSAKWEHKKQVRAEAGKMGGVAKASKSSKAKQNLANVANANFAKQNVANLANATFAKQKKQNLAKLAVNVNVNDNVNVNGNGNVNVPDGEEVAASGDGADALFLLPDYLIDYLNKKTGSNYKLTDQVNALIGCRVLDGYKLEDFIKVIDNKCAEWSCDGKMRSYLRPSTLFGDKFEEYLNAPTPIEVEEKENRLANVEALRDQYSAKSKELEGVALALAGMNSRDDPDKWDRLKVKSAALEDELDNLQRRIEKAKEVAQ